MMNARKGVRLLHEKGLFIFGFRRLIAWIKKVQDAFMKSLLVILSILLNPGFCAPAATEQEKAFVEKYKTALETKDTTTLQSWLYTIGADPMIVGFLQNDAVKRRGRQSFQDRLSGPDTG